MSSAIVDVGHKPLFCGACDTLMGTCATSSVSAIFFVYGWLHIAAIIEV